MLAETNTSMRLAEWTATAGAPLEHLGGMLQLCLLDFVGLAAFGGRFGESSPPLRAAIALAGDGAATIVGDRATAPVACAALLNGAHAHTLDFDDTNAAAALHPGAPVIAATLAQAERLRSSGTDFLTAMAIGYEVCCRVGAACTAAAYDRGFHLTSVAGIFGAVAGAARLAGANASIVDAAFGLAASRAAGSMQYLANGSWNKRYHPGFAAHDGLTVLAIAEAGGRGASDVFDGQYGVFTAFTPAPQRERLLAGLGEDWLLLDTALKPYPSCRLTHGAIDASRVIHDTARGALADASVRVELSPTAYKIVGEPMPNKVLPSNIVDAQFSVYFQVAATLLHGSPSWSSYDRIGDEDVMALSSRIEVVPASGHGAAESVVTVQSAAGTFREHVAEPLGEPSRPLTWDEAVAKFMTLAAPVFGEEHARSVADAVAAIEHEVDMAHFARSLRPICEGMPS